MTALSVGGVVDSSDGDLPGVSTMMVTYLVWPLSDGDFPGVTTL